MSDDFEIDINLVRQLVDGKIDDDNAERLLKLPRKDIGRFLQYNQVLQERVAWNDRILIRLSDKLYVVSKPGGKRETQCECGYSFGDYRQNWKLKSKI